MNTTRPTKEYQQKQEILRLLAAHRGEVDELSILNCLVIAGTAVAGTAGTCYAMKSAGVPGIDGIELAMMLMLWTLIGMLLAGAIDVARYEYMYRNLTRLQNKNLSTRQIAKIQRNYGTRTIQRLSEQDPRYANNLISGGLNNASPAVMRAIAHGAAKNYPEYRKPLRKFMQQRRSMTRAPRTR